MNTPSRRCFAPPYYEEENPHGIYAWDMWEQWALEDGVPKELAALGSQVIREAYENEWSDDLKQECGWEDDGRLMLWFALNIPEKCRIRWQYLLDSKGDFCWDDPRPNRWSRPDIPD